MAPRLDCGGSFLIVSGLRRKSADSSERSSKVSITTFLSLPGWEEAGRGSTCRQGDCRDDRCRQREEEFIWDEKGCLVQTGCY